MTLDVVAAPTMPAGALDAPPTPPPRRSGGWAWRRRPAAVALSGAVWVVLALLIIVPVLLFGILAVSPRLFDQGPSWFTLSNFSTAFSGFFARALVNSLWLSALTAVLALVLSLALAWGVQRTDLVGRRVWPLLVWTLLIMPSFLVAEGWGYVLQPHGVLEQLGVPTGLAYHAFFGPAGVVFVDTMTIVPFSYMAVSIALAQVGADLEDAARIHGGGRWAVARVVIPLLSPAIFSALAIGFAETISDFGVASTLAANAHFPVATYTLFQAVDSDPANFGVASAISWVLVAASAIPIACQARALRGRSFVVLSGRSRPATRRRLSRRGQVVGATAAGALFTVALAAPVLGAVIASCIKGFGTGISAGGYTLANYGEVFNGSASFGGPLAYSTRLAVITATIVAVLGLVVARMMTSRSAATVGRLIDLVLVGSVALPGIVLGAGYIFAYNLPVVAHLGIVVYGTTPLLAMAYVATCLPPQARLMVGPLSQLHDNMLDAARVHGAGPAGAWRRAAIPLLARSLLWAWLLTFAKTLLELPVSQLLYPPSVTPAAVAINDDIGTSNRYGVGTAMSVVAMAEMFGVIVLGLGLFHLLAPEGWRRVGGGRRG